MIMQVRWDKFIAAPIGVVLSPLLPGNDVQFSLRAFRTFVIVFELWKIRQFKDDDDLFSPF